MESVATFALKILATAAGWIHRHHEARMTPLAVRVRAARVEGRRIKREIKLATPDRASALCSAVMKWYGEFELRLAEEAPVVFDEFRSPGIPVGYRTALGEVRTPITLDVLARVVRDDLARLRDIEIRISSSAARVRVMRARRRLRARL